MLSLSAPGLHDCVGHSWGSAPTSRLQGTLLVSHVVYLYLHLGQSNAAVWSCMMLFLEVCWLTTLSTRWKIGSLTSKYSVIKVVHRYTQIYLTDISGPWVIRNVSPTFQLLPASVTHWHLCRWQIPTCQMFSAVAHWALISLLIRWLLTSGYSQS